LQKPNKEIKSNAQFPKSQTKIKFLKWRLVVFVHCDLICSLGFIPDQNIRGQAWDLLLFGVWDFRLVRL